MPDTPQPDPDLDTQLVALQQSMADIGVVLSTVIALRKEAFRALQLLPDELRQLKDQIGVPGVTAGKFTVSYSCFVIK